jgi:hypothetical protein
MIRNALRGPDPPTAPRDEGRPGDGADDVK